jgi:hypothetical protein
MRAGWVAVAGILIAASYFLPAVTTGFPPEIEPLRNGLMILILGWLAVEAIVLGRRTRFHREEVAKARQLASDHEARVGQLSTELQALQRKVQGLEQKSGEGDRRVDALAAENAELRRAYDDARAQLARAEQQQKAKVDKAADEEVVGFLALLQSKGRFVDFVMDDVTKYPDAQIAAAARVVHQGCASVVREYFDIKPVADAAEGAPLTLESDYDSRRFRLLGRVTGEPPFRGRLLHRGWLTTAVRLPEPVPTVPGAAPQARGIIAPAEVELH